MPEAATLMRQGSGASERIPGSFRDPSGYVFRREGRLFRAIDTDCYAALMALVEKGLWTKLIAAGLLVPTCLIEDPALRQTLAAESPGYQHFLEHQIVPQISYPYEWSVSMLADAALCTLDLQLRLLEAGCSLKDASAYNIQFVAGRPQFIDLSSIERPARLDIWFALGQFQRMFTYPLLLCRYHGWDLRSYFLTHLDGRSLEEMGRLLGWVDRLRPGLLLDFTLPLLLSRKADRSAAGGSEMLERANRDAAPQVMNLRRLRSKIKRLADSYKPRGVWAEYTSTCSYDDEAQQAKRALVRQFLEAARPARVLDMGCNTGDYSYLAAECGAQVLAADGDHDAVEILYRRLRRSPAAITPLVIDLTNPSPAIGYRNEERPGFLQRLDVDCVLALALMHHLLVTGNLSLPAIRDLFYSMTQDYLVLEYVPTDDVMFRRLMKFRVDLFGDLTLDRCRQVFQERFTLVSEEPIAGSPRTLFILRKRS